ncbi:MAG: hypothetical protein HF978_02220 [Desulfobacteraceae bacterium]|nr:hypothetical protein [Desulfobacteraceae bacterium]MBC2754340.1 hypothetical protein [Desulfobacteraceae bacterium]
MANGDIIRKDLDNEEFIQLRKNTEKIAEILSKRLKGHLDILKPLFNPVKLLGAYLKSANMDDVPGSDKAFARLQEQYAAVCEKPFGLPKKLQTPLSPISKQLVSVPFKYDLFMGDTKDKATTIVAATRWVLSFQSECPYSRLKAMVTGAETRQADDMKQALIEHLTIATVLENSKELTQLLEDLRYEMEIQTLEDLGGLPVVILKAPIQSFLPSDEFMLNVTQLSGIPAFQELVDLDALENMPDPLKEALQKSIQ